MGFRQPKYSPACNPATGKLSCTRPIYMHTLFSSVQLFDSTQIPSTHIYVYTCIYIHVCIYKEIHAFLIVFLRNSLEVPQESFWNIRFSNGARIFAIYKDLLRFYKSDGCIASPHAMFARTISAHRCKRMAKTGHSPFHKQLIGSLKTSEHVQALAPQTFDRSCSQRLGSETTDTGFAGGRLTICDWLPYAKITSATKSTVALRPS